MLQHIPDNVWIERERRAERERGRQGKDPLLCGRQSFARVGRIRARGAPVASGTRGIIPVYRGVCVCVRKQNPKKKDSWAEGLPKHQISGWSAVSAEGLQGKGSRERSVIFIHPHRYFPGATSASTQRLMRFRGRGRSPSKIQGPWLVRQLGRGHLLN